VPLSKTGAELLFEMISQRYERGATLITSNLPFVMSKTCILHDEWTETFGTERLTGALLDRLTHHVVRRAGRPLDAPLIRLTLRDERRELSSGAKPHPKIHRNRLIQPALSWPQRAKAASQPPAIREARLTGRRLVARLSPKPKVACFCAALWPGFTPPLTPRWIHEMNPSRDLCNKAALRQHHVGGNRADHRPKHAPGMISHEGGSESRPVQSPKSSTPQTLRPTLHAERGLTKTPPLPKS